MPPPGLAAPDSPPYHRARTFFLRHRPAWSASDIRWLFYAIAFTLPFMSALFIPVFGKHVKLYEISIVAFVLCALLVLETRRITLNRWLLGFLVACLVSTLVHFTLFAVVRAGCILVYIAFYMLCRAFLDQGSALTGMRYFVYGSVLPTCYGLYAYVSYGLGVTFLQYPWQEYKRYVVYPGPTPRLASTLVEPNVYGLYLVVAVLFGLFLLAKTHQLAFGAIALLNTAALLLTFSTVAHLVFLLDCVAVGYAYRGNVYVRKALVPLILVAALAVPLAGRRAVDKLSNIATDTSPGDRLLTAKTGLMMYMDHPLLGVGPGNFGGSFGEYSAGAYEVRRIANNVYVELLAEVGTFGFLLYTLFLGSLVVRGLRWSQKSEGGVLLVLIVLSIAAYFMAFPTFTIGYVWVALLLVDAAADPMESETGAYGKDLVRAGDPGTWPPLAPASVSGSQRGRSA